MVGEVAIDDCRYVDPCTRPNTCEHDGICSIREDRVICNCDNTGNYKIVIGIANAHAYQTFDLLIICYHRYRQYRTFINICKFTAIVGYIGENCHFATFRKTCEELALLGYTRNDVYLIDIDGNGKFPPAHVKCEFQIEADSSTTVVEHNLPSQVVRPI